MREVFYCEKCNKAFHSREDCIEHERQCVFQSFTCMKCGNTLEWKETDTWAFAKAEECHTIDLGRLGYGSSLDGCDVKIQVCDDCLREWIESFTYEGQESIINSGSNRYLSTDIWIREAKGELTDEEYEENHMYSPRQIRAYEEKFPKCKLVKVRVHKDGSAGSWCPHNAHGDEFGRAGANICSECFTCTDFIERDNNTLIEIINANYDGNTPFQIVQNHRQKYLEHTKEKNE